MCESYVKSVSKLYCRIIFGEATFSLTEEANKKLSIDKRIKMNKILLVEDDYHLGLILKDHLEISGYEVSLLRIPSKTVENLLEEKFDLVITDKLLNGIDGTLICAAIRNTEGISEIPILMMSGYDGAEKDCLAAGANKFIAKPFEVDVLLQSIKKTLNKA